MAGLLEVLQGKIDRLNDEGAEVRARLRLPDGRQRDFGRGEPGFTLHVKNRRGEAALASLDETRIVEAYMAGDLDIEGDMLALFEARRLASDRHPLRYLWCFLQPVLFGQVSSDKRWIAQHYDYEDDFYLTFLDRKRRCYSHGVYRGDAESLEDGILRKLDFAMDAAGIKPGMRVLDIGGGWGAFSQHAGQKGVRVTSLTISKASEAFLNRMIQAEKLPCTVIRQHLLEYRTAEKFDAIVNLGVTEHLPDYKASLAKYQELVKPGGRIYLDASASREKYGFSSFIYRYIYPGNCSPMCLADYTAALAHSPLKLLNVYNDRHNYFLTAKAWAENLDKAKDEVVARWGQALYRKFQIYLWGTADVLKRDILQAYRLVLES